MALFLLLQEVPNETMNCNLEITRTKNYLEGKTEASKECNEEREEKCHSRLSLPLQSPSSTSFSPLSLPYKGYCIPPQFSAPPLPIGLTEYVVHGRSVIENCNATLQNFQMISENKSKNKNT